MSESMSPQLIAAMREIEKGRFATDRMPLGPQTVDGWVIATDGHVAVLMRGSCGPDAAEGIAGPVRKWLAAEPIGLGEVETAALWRFAGEPKPEDCHDCDGARTVTCDECDGTGEVDCECHCGHAHESECEECDGDGTWPCETCCLPYRSPARFFGEVVNRSLIGKAYPVVPPSERLTVSKLPSGTLMLRPVGSDEWRVYLMAMRDTKTEVDFDQPETWARKVIA